MNFEEKLYPWGDSWEIGRTNLWQGEFPKTNQKRDGYYGLAPVDAFQSQNKYEMYDMLGNTWEWTSTMYEYLKFNSFFKKTFLEKEFFPLLPDFEIHSIKMIQEIGELLKVAHLLILETEKTI